jgi:hypothetical protein
VSGLAWCIGALVASYAAVATAQIIAPSATRAAGATIAVGFILFALVGGGNAITGMNTNNYPVWYSVVFFGIVIVGAVYGALTDLKISNPKPPASTIPNVLRWILVLPVSIVALCALSFGFSFLKIAYPALTQISGVEGRFFTGVAFIALATAIAPSGRRVIVSILGGFWLFGGLAWLAGGILRPLIVPQLEKLEHGYTFEFRDAAWIQTIESLAWIAAALIPMIATFRSKNIAAKQ